MDPRAYRIAQRFVQSHVRLAKYSREFLRWTESMGEFRNPQTGRMNQFVSLPSSEQAHIYRQWVHSRGGQDVEDRRQRKLEEDAKPKRKKPETKEEITAQNLEIAREGKEMPGRRVLSSGGEGQVGRNQSFVVKLGHEGATQIFIYKPAKGEEAGLRNGIPAGQYHAREQATYAIDSLMGGDPIVPVTQTRGRESGSYQLWSTGARQMHGDDLDKLVKKVKPEDLHRSPDFERLNVLDLITGHEDRHRGNLLYHFDGEETPENLRLIAIDNGLSLASPSTRPEHRVYQSPFEHMYVAPDIDWEKELPPLGGAPMGGPAAKAQSLADTAKKRGAAAVAKSLSRISPEMQKDLGKIKLTDAAKAITDAGVDEEGAVRAALVRIASLQADPTIFGDLLKRHGGDLEEAWTNFQHLSGYKDDLLFRSGAGDRKKDIDQALRSARPRGGWGQAVDMEKAQAAMEKQMKQWGGGDSDAGTVKSGPKKQSSEALEEAVHNVKERWLRQAFLRVARKNKLIVSEVGPGRKPKVIGTFELDRKGNVKESYKDFRFRQDVRRGLRLMGKRYTPKDGASFMAALEKVYGARSMYDVKRT